MWYVIQGHEHEKGFSIIHKAGFIFHAFIYTRTCSYMATVGISVYTFVANCAQRMRVHTLTFACLRAGWARGYTDCRCQSSNMLNFQGQRRPALAFQPITKALQGHRGPTRYVCGCIPSHTLVCLYFNPRRNLRYASMPAASAYMCMKYKPGLIVHCWYKELR